MPIYQFPVSSVQIARAIALNKPTIWLNDDQLIVKTNNEFFLIDIREIVGSGTSGKVYYAYPITKVTQPSESYTVVTDEKKLFVAKVSSAKNEADVEAGRNEHQLLSRFYKTKPLVISDEFLLIISEYIPGVPLLTQFETKVQQHEELKKLNLIERLNIVVQLMLTLNLLHRTRQTKKYSPSLQEEVLCIENPIVHSDIKNLNTLLDITEDNGTKKLNIHLFDFGLSFDISVGQRPKNKEAPDGVFVNPNISIKHGGVPLYFPVETLKPKIWFGPKTDVYMISGLCSAILGTDDPYEEKTNNIATDEELKKRPSSCRKDKQVTPEERAKRPYSLKGLDNLVLPDIKMGLDIDIKKLIRNFLNRMQDNDYDKRPESNECLRFFTTLRLLFLINAQRPDDKEALSIQAARLMMVEQNLWKGALRNMEPHAVAILNLERYRLLSKKNLTYFFPLSFSEPVEESPFSNLLEQLPFDSVHTLMQQLLANIRDSELLQRQTLKNRITYLIQESPEIKILFRTHKNTTPLLLEIIGQETYDELFNSHTLRMIFRPLFSSNSAPEKSHRPTHNPQQ